jgi:diaminopimelate decarboxylase
VDKNITFSAEKLESIVQEFGTPFHIYDEDAIRKNVRRLQAAFSWSKDFKEYFAVKATPKPYILKLLRRKESGRTAVLCRVDPAEKVGLSEKRLSLPPTIHRPGNTKRPGSWEPSLTG